MANRDKFGRTNDELDANMPRAKTEGEIRVPVTEEIANVRKVERQAGEVAITKNVETETKRISEPVTQTKVSVHTREIPEGEE